ncbi:HupU protein [Motiliproteus coralliicola]|uniref:hydrogenase (acceptor) n=1 Tax=Motiliproteus coralliicola TaxID=2283196 RepID=A0A369WDL8_9GAMM|nr:HupU protein [Motiliproteus coralliicola]RDE19852.1 HupU protein [Motiliproteus coralliicola]
MNQPRTNLLWLQSGGCGGCTMSLLGAEQPTLFEALDAFGIELLWHASLSGGQGPGLAELIEQIEAGELKLDLLCIEGAVMTGPGGTGLFHVLAGTDTPMMAVIERLAKRAGHVIAVGSCSAFGGINRSNNNPAEAIGLQYIGEQPGGLLGSDYRSDMALPVVNVSGCPAHPDWILQSLQALSQGMLDQTELDEYQRPRFYTEHLAHHGCPRNEFYEYKASAEQPCQSGCLMENLGCQATQAHADCNIRLWNGGGSCPKAGYACINCTAPEFEEPGHPFGETPKLAGVPVGLPTDMPKAWFIALSSLSKAATPKRLKVNATSETVKIVPNIYKKRR